MQLLLFNAFNGLIQGVFYALMALGLALILSLNSVINMAHGGFLVIGAYLAYTLNPYLGFWGALVAGPVLAGGIGLIVERVLIRPIYKRPDPIYSLLLTFGLALIIEDMTRTIWGPQGLPLEVPDIINSPVSEDYFFVTGYRLFVVGITAAAAIVRADEEDDVSTAAARSRTQGAFAGVRRIATLHEPGTGPDHAVAGL